MTIPYQKILVPLDGSALAAAALPHAAALARQSQAEITLLRVVPSIISDEYLPSDPMLPESKDLEQQQCKRVDEALAGLEEPMANLKFQHISVKTVVQVGYAADRIVEYATAHNSDLIVMSTHGRTGLQRWLLGSVASKVATAAPCPVLLVRATLEGEQA
jgi:nucleotide-binding universal stress UspA family protein